MNSTKQYMEATETNILTCPLWRRLVAIAYDSVLLICVIFIAWQPVPLLPDSLPALLSRGLKLSYLMGISFVFFAWSWTHGGQTLGMRAWKIKLKNFSPLQDQSISWRTSWMRFIGALASWVFLGMGFIWSILHHRKHTWHDIYSRSEIVSYQQSD